MLSLINLKKKIVDAATAYYSGNPIMSDEQFDELTEQLRIIASDDKLLVKVGWGSQVTSTDLKKVLHDVVITRGLNKIKVEPDSMLPNNPHYETLKYDGASVTLYYDKNGDLSKAVTRNDGVNGFDVTSKLQYIVPTHINSPIHAITGEFILSKQCNAAYFQSNSPRNVAVGMLMKKSVDPSEIVKFDFVAYRIISVWKGLDESYDMISLLKADRCIVNETLGDLGFREAPIQPVTINRQYGEAFEFLSEYIRHGHTYHADGVVYDTGLTFTDANTEIIIGYKDELAYKAQTETAIVEVKDVIWNHTRTGRYVPTVIYDEVNISGAKCSRATGHNAKYIRENNIGVGTKIEIVRSGEVIPWISDIVESTECNLPIYCDCGYELKWKGVDLICDNPDCEYNQHNRLYNYIANVGAVKGVSRKIISAMMGFASWEDISDIYKNPVKNWSGLSVMTGLGDSAVNLANKTTDYLYNKVWYQNWIVGLGLKGIGWKNAGTIGEKLYNYLINPDRLKLYWRFSDINGIGGSIEQTINFNKEYICELFDCVRGNLIIDNDKDIEDTVNSDLIKVCITGKLESGTKSSFYDRFKDKIIESDVNNCDILICSKVGSSKYNKAMKLGKRILSESEAICEFDNIYNKNEKEPECYISNNEPYPLCKGNGEIKCRECCWFEDYTDYNSPHPEEIIYEIHVEEENNK